MAADLNTPVTSYLWTDTTPEVDRFHNAAAEDTTWTAPDTTTATQVVTLTLTVTDSNGTAADLDDDITVRGQCHDHGPSRPGGHGPDR